MFGRCFCFVVVEFTGIAFYATIISIGVSVLASRADLAVGVRRESRLVRRPAFRTELALTVGGETRFVGPLARGAELIAIVGEPRLV